MASGVPVMSSGVPFPFPSSCAYLMNFTFGSVYAGLAWFALPPAGCIPALSGHISKSLRSILVLPWYFLMISWKYRALYANLRSRLCESPYPLKV